MALISIVIPVYYVFDVTLLTGELVHGIIWQGLADRRVFLMYGQNPEGFETFDRFYKHKIEVLVEHFKSKLDD